MFSNIIFIRLVGVANQPNFIMSTFCVTFIFAVNFALSKSYKFKKKNNNFYDYFFLYFVKCYCNLVTHMYVISSQLATAQQQPTA